MTPVRLAVSASLILLSALTLYLSVYLLSRWRRRRANVWWGVALFIGFLSILDETLLYAGFWGEHLIQSFIFLSALLVGLLSLGSISSAGSYWFRAGWLSYVAIISIALAFFSFTQHISRSILSSGVVIGNPPFYDVLFSSLLTVPGACAIALFSLVEARRNHKPSLYLIFAGVVVISFAGFLFVLREFPVTLYYSEFAGLLLIFFGVRTPLKRRSAAPL
ncbi:MAG: hypothetical protein QXP70_00035 [Methanomassiliicoccales archaeon]